jgi:adenylate cyclase
MAIALGRQTRDRLARIGTVDADDHDARGRKSLLVLTALIILPVSALWGLIYLAFGQPVAILPFIYFAISVGSLLVFARTHSFRFLLAVQLLDILFAPTLGQMLTGGFLPSGVVGLWGILAPLGALVFLDVPLAVRWFVAYLAVFLATGIAGELFFPDADLPGWFSSAMLALNVSFGGAVVFTLLAFFAHQRREALRDLQLERDKTESLLLNVLPSSVADRLRARAGTIADSFDSATILFADVADFTPLAGRLRPTELVELLDRLFSRFDALVENHGLEKIKTIGDCYMVAAGVPDPRPDHARAAALLALDLRDAMRSPQWLGRDGLQLRIGIGSGAVVAGVIGRKRFLYDLWGDAVNTASRMESHGTPGEIQITRETYELLKDDFVCRPRGMVAIKGKGEMPTWYLEAPMAASA